jgi:hypothetical protein
MIEFNPEQKQVLLMWKLAFAGGEIWLKELPSGLASKSKRDSLISSGLILEEKRTQQTPGKRKQKLIRVILEDKGWAWLSDNMDSPIWESKAAADVLRAALTSLGAFLEKKHLALADVISAQSDRPESDSSIPEAIDIDKASESTHVSRTEPDFAAPSLEERIGTAYSELVEGRVDGQVRLADLRARLSDTPRESLDEALERMSREGRIILGRLDNPKEITAADDDAKITTSYGEPRHLLFMEIASHVL